MDDLEGVVADLLLAVSDLDQRLDLLDGGDGDDGDDGDGGDWCGSDGQACQTEDGLPGVIQDCTCIPF